jgi:hypothetical protein
MSARWFRANSRGFIGIRPGSAPATAVRTLNAPKVWFQEDEQFDTAGRALGAGDRRVQARETAVSGLR